MKQSRLGHGLFSLRYRSWTRVHLENACFLFVEADRRPLGADIDAFEIVLAMTTLTVAAKVPSMDIVAAVTGITGLRSDDGLVHAPAVAIATAQSLVRTAQTEVRLSIVIEAPDTPAIGRVTEGAVPCQTPFVDVIGLVTIDALSSYAPVAAVEMAVLAGRRGMQAEQRETRQVVIETDPLTPTVTRVTAGTILAQASGMDVVRGMTGPTAGLEFLVDILALVTGDAMDPAVPPEQGIVGIAIMAKAYPFPGPLTMTVLALPAITSFVPVLAPMAGHAGGLEFLLVEPPVVAGRTGDACMTPAQGIVRVATVIERDLLPSPLVVTVSALWAELPAMAVVDRMTAPASPIDLGETAVGMTGPAARLVLVGLAQGEIGLVMIEVRDLPPVRLAVAALAAPAELAGMDVLALVAGDTARWGVPLGLARPMAGATDHLAMRAAQDEIGLAMVESGWIEVDDIGLSSLVLPVTGAAFPFPDAGDPAMEAPLAVDIGADLLVAVETEPPLAALLKTFVALAAVLLVLGMGLDEVAGQEDRIEDPRLGEGR